MDKKIIPTTPRLNEPLTQGTQENPQKTTEMATITQYPNPGGTKLGEQVFNLFNFRMEKLNSHGASADVSSTSTTKSNTREVVITMPKNESINSALLKKIEDFINKNLGGMSDNTLTEDKFKEILRQFEETFSPGDKSKISDFINAQFEIASEEMQAAFESPEWQKYLGPFTELLASVNEKLASLKQDPVFNNLPNNDKIDRIFDEIVKDLNLNTENIEQLKSVKAELKKILADPPADQPAIEEPSNLQMACAFLLALTNAGFISGTSFGPIKFLVKYVISHPIAGPLGILLGSNVLTSGGKDLIALLVGWIANKTRLNKSYIIDFKNLSYFWQICIHILYAVAAWQSFIAAGKVFPNATDHPENLVLSSALGGIFAEFSKMIINLIAMILGAPKKLGPVIGGVSDVERSARNMGAFAQLLSVMIYLAFCQKQDADPNKDIITHIALSVYFLGLFAGLLNRKNSLAPEAKKKN